MATTVMTRDDVTKIVSWAALSVLTAGDLKIANNLSDVASASAARSNLGLGSAAQQPTTAFDPAGAAASAQASSLQKAANLADLASASAARSALGLGSAALSATTDFDAANAATNAIAGIGFSHALIITTDFNLATTPGHWMDAAIGLANAPDTANHWHVLVLPDTGGGGFVQVAWGLKPGTGNNLVGRAVRAWHGSVWTPWIIEYVGPPTWTPLTFVSGYKQQTFGYAPACTLDAASGKVTLRGITVSNDGSSIPAGGQQINVIPVGFRPAGQGEFAVACTNTSNVMSSNGRIEITTAGAVSFFVSTAGPNWVSLDGISYYLN